MKRKRGLAWAGVVLLFSVFCLQAQESAPQTAGGESAKDERAAASATITGSGKPNFIPIWTNSTTLSSSMLFEKSGKVGIGTQTPAATLEVNGTANFRQAVTFASGQTFPGAASLGANTFTNTQTISNGDVSVSNGNLDLPQTPTGGSAGAINLGGNPVLHACCPNSTQNIFVGNAGNFSADASSSDFGAGDNTALGFRAMASLTSGFINTAIGYQALFLNTTGAANTGCGDFALYSNTTGFDNTGCGDSALASNTSGYYNTASGGAALQLNTTGNNNTATGFQALRYSSTGSNNTASGFEALFYNTTGSYNTAVGYNAGSTVTFPTTGSNSTFVGAYATATVDGLTNASAMGYDAQVNESNALVLGSPQSVNGSANTNVGIDVANPAFILTVLQGGGVAMADGWMTYSSRRWKSDIHPLQGALGKVERLQGVSYTYTANGKHDIGMIAEDVGKVVPEVVSYEDNGKDAQGIDYARLTALLIEAVKQQQREISRLESEVRVLQGEK
jgi:hypothetical protein